MNDLAVSVSGWKAGAILAWLTVVLIAGHAWLFSVAWEVAGAWWWRWRNRNGDGWVVVEWDGPMESLFGKLARKHPNATSIRVESLTPSFYRYRAETDIGWPSLSEQMAAREESN